MIKKKKMFFYFLKTFRNKNKIKCKPLSWDCAAVTIASLYNLSFLNKIIRINFYFFFKINKYAIYFFGQFHRFFKAFIARIQIRSNASQLQHNTTTFTYVYSGEMKESTTYLHQIVFFQFLGERYVVKRVVRVDGFAQIGKVFLLNNNNNDENNDDNGVVVVLLLLRCRARWVLRWQPMCWCLVPGASTVWSMQDDPNDAPIITCVKIMIMMMMMTVIVITNGTTREWSTSDTNDFNKSLTNCGY